MQLMSVHAQNRPVSIHDIQAFKDRGEKFAMLTAYDYSAAQILDEAGVPLLLVGDSLGMVVLGYDSTVQVTMEEMLHHTKAVRRGATRALVVGDMPFGSYHGSEDDAVVNAVRFLKEAGANAVKLEGPRVDLTRRLVEAGIPVMGHLGLTPQAVNQLGGFKVQGREEAAAEKLVADALALQAAGAFCLVLEAVPSDLGARVTEALDIPTIGIGAGADTDGQVLVFHDFLGLTSGRLPRFVKQYTTLRGEIVSAAKAFQAEVASSDYPGPEHQY
ncbi:3-methyl-2-oxobutanoate hydroxymethyltransferase [Euzebya pacifica]|uniref:3-methyl-2-oxobutanoate hydroxymethyltransferase n=2 Tax=Euzebya pacifica TaxID=1608957 RepID=A0A346XXG6_9ACTN|nr:3-methyl-2-oxobutanoate hydroxymethyltransferase [Euzebya pacifica]